MDNLNFIGISVLALFLVFIFRKKDKNHSDYVLALLNIFFACFLFSDVWIHASLTSASLIFQNLLIFYMFPTYFIYTLLLIHPRHQLKKGWWWVGITAFSFTVFTILDFTLLNDYSTPAAIKKLYEDPPFIYHFFYKGHKLFAIGCLVWLFRKIKEYKQRIRQRHSFIGLIDLNWLRNFSILYMVQHIVSLVIFIAYNFGYIANIAIPFLIINTISVLGVFYLSFYGIRMYVLKEISDTQKEKVPETSVSVEINQPEKYKTSSLSDKEMKALYKQLIKLFEKEKLYEQAQLQIQDVADKLGVHSNKVSQTINSIAQKPFYDFVNSYRVEHFKALLTNPESKQYTILALGIASGFNSKSSMNRIFKHHTGMSPREFQKSQ